MRSRLIKATCESVLAVRDPRFHATERGYQGRFYCELQKQLTNLGLVDDKCLLEMEYQKSKEAHGTRQRPDIILHVPREYSRAEAHQYNYAMWELKHCASAEQAKNDFNKLDEKFTELHYDLGFFINIADYRHHFDSYQGCFADRIVCVATVLTQDGEVHVASNVDDAEPTD